MELTKTRGRALYMTTLRELIRTTPYKQTFNHIYSRYYKNKDYSVEDVMKADSAYLRIFEELPKLPEHDSNNLSIYLTKAQDKDDEEFVDVCLYNEETDELFAMDFVPWSELIDMPVVKAYKATDTECLSYILWEITFWGFSEQKIQEEADRLSKSKYEPLEDLF